MKMQVAGRDARVTHAVVRRHEPFRGDYYLIELEAPELARVVKPGQFVHVRVPRLGESVLRRPFSIYRADDEAVTVLYKCVGKGTQALTRVVLGEKVSLLGPLGNGFPPCPPERLPVLVAGGYGVAPLSLLASRMDRRGILFVGGAAGRDILCTDDFEALGWEVRVTTMDGSAGRRGLVTVALDEWIEHQSDGPQPELFACGPDGMLRAVGERAIANSWQAWLSLDKHMGCGVGACLACVQRVRFPDGHVSWTRICREGPVLESRTIVWDDDAEQGAD